MNLERSAEVKTFKNWGRAYSIQFDLIVFNVDPSEEWVNVIHITKGGDMGGVGDRLPALWLNKNKFFHITTDLKSSRNVVKDYYFSFDKLYHFEMSQSINDNGQEVYKVSINNEVVFTDSRGSAGVFDQVTLYLSDPWYPSFKDFGAISNLTVEQLYDGSSYGFHSMTGIESKIAIEKCF